MDPHGWDDQVARLEREGEAQLEVVTVAAEWAAELCGRVSSVLDIGSGPGVGTCELARCFPQARVLAVDASQPMLARVAARAESLRLGDRVATQLAELPDGIRHLPAADVVYASMVLHHAHDTDAALRALAGVLTGDGLLIVIEHGPAPVGAHVPVIDVVAALGETGFEVLGERVHGGRQIVIARHRPDPPSTQR
jgi:trans-aconitate methyltransferase